MEVIYPSLAIVATGAVNAMTVSIFFLMKMHTNHSLSEHIIASLAMTDLAVACVSMPLYVSKDLSYITPTEPTCAAMLLVQITWCVVAAYNVVLLSFDRYLLCVWPVQYRHWKRRHFIWIMLLLPYAVILLLFALPVTLINAFSDQLNHCPRCADVHCSLPRCWDRRAVIVMLCHLAVVILGVPVFNLMVYLQTRVRFKPKRPLCRVTPLGSSSVSIVSTPYDGCSEVPSPANLVAGNAKMSVNFSKTGMVARVLVTRQPSLESETNVAVEDGDVIKIADAEGEGDKEPAPIEDDEEDDKEDDNAESGSGSVSPDNNVCLKHKESRVLAVNVQERAGECTREGGEGDTAVLVVQTLGVPGHRRLGGILRYTGDTASPKRFLIRTRTSVLGMEEVYERTLSPSMSTQPSESIQRASWSPIAKEHVMVSTPIQLPLNLLHRASFDQRNKHRTSRFSRSRSDNSEMDSQGGGASFARAFFRTGNNQGSGNRLLKMLVLIVVMFEVLYLPFFMLCLLTTISELKVVQPPREDCPKDSLVWGVGFDDPHLPQAFIWLLMCNSFINPLIYPFFHRKYRTGATKLVKLLHYRSGHCCRTMCRSLMKNIFTPHRKRMKVRRRSQLNSDPAVTSTSP
jgi:hypothetical protein